MELCAFDKLFTKSVPHILEKIFLSLDYKSFKTCLDVSKTWNELLKSDSFRAKGKIVFHHEILGEEEKLWWAARNGFIDGCKAGRAKKEVRKLLSTGMLDVNCTRGLRSTAPLYEAAINCHKYMVQPIIVEMLLSAGAELNAVDHMGRTPLFLAAYHGHKEAVALLLHKGADHTIRNDGFNGLTPLQTAEKHGHTDVVEILRERGIQKRRM